MKLYLEPSTSSAQVFQLERQSTGGEAGSVGQVLERPDSVGATEGAVTASLAHLTKKPAAFHTFFWGNVP